jgi:hypothetical protein
MQPEFEMQNQVFEENGFQILLTHSFEENELTVKREIKYIAEKELDEDAKSELIKKINLSINKPYIFIKPILSEN